MHTKLLPVMIAAALLAPSTADAITNGTPDYTHDEAGATVQQSLTWPEEEGGPTFQFQQCSGVLVAPRVFLTAAHCTDFFRYARAFQQFGVTFAPEAPFGPFDASDDGLMHGTTAQDPGYRPCPITTCKTADPHDIAALILDEPASAEPAQLPSAKALDRAAARNALRRTAFTVTGYGSAGDPPGSGRPLRNDGRGTRRTASASYMALDPAVLRLSQNLARGDGGACDGDSGGPIYLGDTVVALTISGDLDPGCTATEVGYRLDTRAARTFLSSPQLTPYLTLP